MATRVGPYGSRIAIMQPYFFPYAGYFGLIHAADAWVVFDTAQYIRKGWVNRNRVLTRSSQGWKHVRIPVRKAPRETAIRDIAIAHPAWSEQLIRDLDFYRDRQAPYYSEVVELVHDVCQRANEEAMCESNPVEVEGAPHAERLLPVLWHSLRAVCERLGLDTPFYLFSEMELRYTLPEMRHAGDWALQIAAAMQAREYVNPPGGEQLFSPREFREHGIALEILRPSLQPYPQYSTSHPSAADAKMQDPFQPGLSILDVLMWLAPEDARRVVENYEISVIA